MFEYQYCWKLAIAGFDKSERLSNFNLTISVGRKRIVTEK